MDSYCNKSAEVNGGTPFAEARGSATRWCAIGDTIETTMSNGSVMTHEITNSMACAFANELIASGRWRVSPNEKGQRPG